MTALWLFAATGWALALLAFVQARRTARSLAQLTQQYWELKYEHGEVKARVRALAPTPEEQAAAATPAAPPASFVPLSSVKRS